MDSSGRKKTQQRCKRPARPDKDRAPPKYKRRKKEEEEKTLQSSSSLSSSDPLLTHLTQVGRSVRREQRVQTDPPCSDCVCSSQLSVLPLMEPVLGVDLSLFPPYGSSSLGRDSRLSGSFGNASLEGSSDYYSQLIYKVLLQDGLSDAAVVQLLGMKESRLSSCLQQNNLSNPPTPPASLPPTPPPVARQKLVNGFATTEELTRKELAEQDGETWTLRFP